MSLSESGADGDDKTGPYAVANRNVFQLKVVANRQQNGSLFQVEGEPKAKAF